MQLLAGVNVAERKIACFTLQLECEWWDITVVQLVGALTKKYSHVAFKQVL